MRVKSISGHYFTSLLRRFVLPFSFFSLIFSCIAPLPGVETFNRVSYFCNFNYHVFPAIPGYRDFLAASTSLSTLSLVHMHAFTHLPARPFTGSRTKRSYSR